MATLFKTSDVEIKTAYTNVNDNKLKLKKGESIESLVSIANKLVDEKLKKYKDASKCITDINELKRFFESTNDIIAIDTETTRLIEAAMLCI